MSFSENFRLKTAVLGESFSHPGFGTPFYADSFLQATPSFFLLSSLPLHSLQQCCPLFDLSAHNETLSRAQKSTAFDSSLTPLPYVQISNSQLVVLFYLNITFNTTSTILGVLHRLLRKLRYFSKCVVFINLSLPDTYHHCNHQAKGE